MSISTNGPLPAQRDPVTVARSATVYRIAESITTRMILVVMTFVARELETPRSIFQMRYASNPRNIPSWYENTTPWSGRSVLTRTQQIRCKCKATEHSHARHRHFGGDDCTACLRIAVDGKSTSDLKVISENATLWITVT